MKQRNYARFYILLNRCPVEDKNELKADIISQFTNGRTESIRAVSDKEYEEICNALQDASVNHQARERERAELRRKRSSVLHQLQRLGIDTSNWDKVNAYCSDPRIAGKEFRALTAADLDALNTKLRAIYNKTNHI